MNIKSAKELVAAAIAGAESLAVRPATDVTQSWLRRKR